jgi:hypothetical protein
MYQGRRRPRTHHEEWLAPAVTAASTLGWLGNVLDNASYFTANAVQEFVEDIPIELCYLPRGSALVNPAEECWRQLDQELGNRLFETLDDLRDAALSALNRIEVLDVFTYLFP